jgi:hypothetical protein
LGVVARRWDYLVLLLLLQFIRESSALLCGGAGARSESPDGGGRGHWRPAAGLLLCRRRGGACVEGKGGQAQIHATGRGLSFSFSAGGEVNSNYSTLH